jgi:hypothetical protein
MTDDEIDVAWSHRIAGLTTATLVAAGVMPEADIERVKGIIAEEIYVRLCAKDRPDRNNWLYQSPHP